MDKQITTKSTKNDILKAYNDLLTEIKEKKTDNPKIVAEQEKKQAVVKEASQSNHEMIIKNMSELKMRMGNYFEELENQLITESKKLSGISEAIEIEQQNLEDIYGIKANADSLAALLQAQKEKKEAFEKEQTEKAAMAKEELETEKKERKREEDEFQYNLKISRKKELDIYAEKQNKLEKELKEKKTAFEKEVKEREEYLSAREGELKEYKEKVESFPAELENAVKTATTQLKAELKTQYEYETQIATKDTEAELRLKEQEISNLKAKIEDQSRMIDELSKKANDASSQVQDIALKAIESSSNKQQFIVREKENLEK